MNSIAQVFTNMANAVIGTLGGTCNFNGITPIKYATGGSDEVLPTDMVVPEHYRFILITQEDLKALRLEINRTWFSFPNDHTKWTLVWYKIFEAGDEKIVYKCLVGYNHPQGW